MNGRRGRQHGGALAVLLGWAVTLALVALALEGILRLCGLRPVVTINEPDRELGWRKRPDESTRKVTSEFDVTFSVNALGLRDDPDLTRAKPAGTRRVLFVGDSFVLGYAVDRSDHFVDLVERALVADGRRVEVLNGGTEGYSTDQEALWLEKEGLSFEPDVVVACFYQNDVFWNGQRSYAGTPKPRFSADGRLEPASGDAPPPRGWLARHSALGGILDRFATSSRHGAQMVWSSGSAVLERDQVVVLKDPPADLADGWARTAACFRRLRETCEGARAKLLLVTIPAREEVEPGAREAFASRSGLRLSDLDPVTPVDRALALAEGLATLDPRPALRAAADDGAPLYYARDWHVNPLGSRVLGRTIYEALCGPALLGGGTSEAGLAVFTPAPARSTPAWPFVAAAIWIALSAIYARSYRDESALAAFAKVGAMVAAVTLVVWGFAGLSALLGPRAGRFTGLALVAALVGWILWKMLPKLSILREVYAAFVRRGRWYMIPLLVAMLSIGGLLVVASSSPFIAPFIYTLF